MARIDLLTAQMRQRTISRVSVQSDEKMKLFGADQQQLGAGAALSATTIGELLGEIAPAPLDGAPVTFPYHGSDGEFEVMVAPGGAGFEMRALSFAPAPTEATQTQSATPTPVAPAPVATEARWYYLQGEEQLGPHTDAQIKTMIRSGTLRRDVYVWHEGLAEWQMAGHSEFRALFPALPNPVGDADNTWYYRSATGQSVPLDRSLLVEKIRSGELAPDTWVWREGLNDWTIATSSELSSSLTARGPMPGLAPIAPPTGGGPRTLPGGGAYNVYGGGDPANTSGGGWEVEVPREARGLFNVGAFLFPVFWCHSMGLPAWGSGIFMLNIASRYIPFVGFLKIPVCFGLGFMGNRIAWRNRRFDSVADFKKCQLMWAIISAAIWAIFIAALVLFLRPFFMELLDMAPNTPTRGAGQPPAGSGIEINYQKPRDS